MTSILELLAFLILGLAPIPLPVCVPPLPEDQKLLQVVPPESLMSVSWFGRGTPNPNSQNLAERMAANPEFQHAFLRVGVALRTYWEREAGEQDEKLATASFNLLTFLSTRPGTAFLRNVDFEQETVRAGVVVHLGAGGALALPTMQMLERWFVDEMGGDRAVEKVEVAKGAVLRSLPVPNGAPELLWGAVDGYLVLAIGEGSGQDLVAALRGGGQGLSANPVYKRVQAKVRVARPSYRTFINFKQILEIASVMMGQEFPRIARAVGVADVECVVSEGGLEGDGFVTRSMLAHTKATGILAMMRGAPLTPEEFRIIPGDASAMAAMRLSLKDLLPRMIELVKIIEPRQAEMMQQELNGGVEEALGVNLQKDLLAHSGDVVTMWNAPSQGGLLISGLTLGVELDNAPAFEKGFAKVMAKLGGILNQNQDKRSRRGRRGRGIYLKRGKLPGGKTYWYLNSVGEEVPCAPSWTVTDSHLVVSAFPQMLRATVQRPLELESSIAGRPGVPGLLGKAVAVQRMDAPKLYSTIYPAAHVLVQLLCDQVQRDGFDLDITALPTAGAILPHLTMETSRFEAVEGGMIWTRQGSIPVLDPALMLTLPVAIVPLVLMNGF